MYLSIVLCLCQSFLLSLFSPLLPQSFFARKVLLESPLGSLTKLGPAPVPVLSPFKQRSKIKSMAAAAVSAAIAVRAR